MNAHYLTAHQPLLRQPQDVANFQRLQHVSVPMAWRHWMASHGLEGINPFAGPQMDQFHGIIRAVAAGMGVALVPRCLLLDDIAAGLVSAPLPDTHIDDLGYWLCHPPAKAHRPPLEGITQWVLGECAGG